MNTLAADHGRLMDRIYRHQRHIYDLTRKYYLLGRDAMIDGLDVAPGQSVLEIGCGTGRNLAAIAGKWPRAELHGLDISAEMLATARASLTRRVPGRDIGLARGDATEFDPHALFGTAGFDRVVLSYTLSMVPDWQAAVAAALAALNPGGQLHIVDFGDQSRLPAWFAAPLNAWLRLFHVAPRYDLEALLDSAARQHAGKLDIRQLHGGYAMLATVALPQRQRLTVD